MIKPSLEVKDPVGFETLELFSKADNYNKWMFNSLVPFCSDNILEIGSGTGNISNFLLNKFDCVTLSDLRDEYCDVLKQKFKGSDNLSGVYKIDLNLPDFDSVYGALFNSFDTVIALNVIEHIKDDLLAITNCKKLLKQKGRLVVLVPAYQSLYNAIDKMLDHYRRYTVKSMITLKKKAGLKIIHSQYFNLAGVFGWWLSGSVLRNKVIPGNQLSLFNRLTPLFQIIDNITFCKMGLSVIVVAEK